MRKKASGEFLTKTLSTVQEQSQSCAIKIQLFSSISEQVFQATLFHTFLIVAVPFHPILKTSQLQKQKGKDDCKLMTKT